jgi:tetratricopeptide (TPR) repeat protein
VSFKRFSLAIRIVIAVVIGFAMLRFLFAGAHGELDPGTKLIGLLMAVVYGLILFALFGFSMIRRFADRFGMLYEPSDKHFRIMPEYSTAEARVKAGRYAEAVEEYRKVIAQHPGDVYAHIRIAELAVERLNDVKLAELELMSAYAKAASEDATVMAAGRLADLYQNTLRNPAQAIEVLHQLKSRLPGTKHVLGAQQRIDALERAKAGHTVPSVPTKMAFRPTDEETLRRRRGY